MRIMLDTNILVSAGAFGGRTAERLEAIAQSYSIVISSTVIDELMQVTNKKFPNRKSSVEEMLRKLRAELFHTPSVIDVKKYPHIRDPKDYPILASAIIADVDILITGDKDFDDVNIKRPEILTIGEFMEKYGGGGQRAG